MVIVPVRVVQPGCVMLMAGAVGVLGAILITAGVPGDTHPSAFLAVTL